jgi:hypothetical protein
MLCTCDLERIAVPGGQDPVPAMWETGVLVEIDGNLSVLLDHEDGSQIPANACACIDDEVTA